MVKDLENISGYERFSLSIKHKFNPLHIYCRLREMKVRKGLALSLSLAYEKNIYNGNGGSRISKAIKTIKDLFPYDSKNRFSRPDFKE